MPWFKAIEVDPVSHQRTGREHVFDVASRDAAIDALLDVLALTREGVRVDPSRTLVEVHDARWTIVAVPTPEGEVPPSLRRAGAKHKRVR